MKLYIAGPMSGYPNLNFPMFYSVEEALVGAGIEVVNPARLDDEGLPEGVPEDEMGQGLAENKQRFLLRDFREVVHCDGIVLLPEWDLSTGANAELAVARFTGLEVWEAQYHGAWAFFEYSVATPDWEMLDVYVEEGLMAQELRRIMR